MFTLQDCSVCFEDFDNDRPPHSIPCGHVFCSPCLESLVSTSPTCPNCRVSYSSSSIRKVVCAQQDSAPNPQPNKPGESEAETLMWQAIQSAVESPMEIRQRHSLVEHNTEEAMKDAGLSANLLTAFNVMRLLVKVEKSHGLLQDKLNTAQAVEQSLCDRISTLEAQSVMRVKPASSSDLQSLLADFQKLQFVVESIDKKTSDIATRLQPGPVAQAQPTPAPIETPTSPASVPIPPTPLEPTRPALLRKPSPRNTINTPSTPTTDQRASFQPPLGLQHQRYPSTPILTGKQPLSPPLTPSHAVESLSDQPLFGSTSQIRRSSSHLTNNLGRASASSTPVNQPPPKYQQIEPPNSPVTPLLRSRTPSVAGLSSPAAERVLPSPPSIQNRTSVPIPTPTPVPVPTSTISPPPAPACSSALKLATTLTLVALHNFSADSDVEHSLKQGETLYPFPQADLAAEWIWCKNAAGKAGYVPKCYVKIEGGNAK